MRLHVVEGEIVLTLDGIVHRVAQGECVVFSVAYRHALRNERDEPAFVAVVGDAGVYRWCAGGARKQRFMVTTPGR
jgi:quercetin dioxygenase-like cupin family protein